MRLTWLAVLSVLVSSVAQGGGFVHNENFTVLTPGVPSQDEAQQFATEILTAAEKFRKQIAIEWLGEELPHGVGRTIINVSYSDRDDKGLTWARDNPRRKYHAVYLSTTTDRARTSTLAHEIAHVVLATQFAHPNRLPAWIEEGIASRYDDKSRITKREAIIRWFARTENWPRLEMILNSENITADDQSSYAAAASLTEYLLSRGSKQTLLDFGRSVSKRGWEQALQQEYKINSSGDLQKSWQTWVRTKAALALRGT